MSRRRLLPLSLSASSALAVTAAATVGGGCSPEFTPASLIQDERIIAIVADPPETAPGQTVELRPVVASPTGTVEDGAGQTTTWWRCPDSDSDSLGDFWECTIPSARLELGGGVPYVDSVPADLFGDVPSAEQVEAGDVTLPEKALGALLGYWRVVGVTMTAGERAVDGFKRVPVFPPFPLAVVDERLADLDVHVDAEGALAPNTNPVLTALIVHEEKLTGPTVLAVKPGTTYVIEPIVDDASLQAYFSLRADLAGLDVTDPESIAELDVDDLLGRFERVRRCEIPVFNWFSSAGRFRRDVTLDEGVLSRVYDARGVACPPVEGDVREPEAIFTVPTGDEDDPLPDDGVIHLWAVLRDGRGGTAVRSIDLPIEE